MERSRSRSATDGTTTPRPEDRPPTVRKRHHLRLPSLQSHLAQKSAVVTSSFNASNGWSRGERLAFAVGWLDFPDDDCAFTRMPSSDRRGWSVRCPCFPHRQRRRIPPVAGVPASPGTSWPAIPMRSSPSASFAATQRAHRPRHPRERRESRRRPGEEGGRRYRRSDGRRARWLRSDHGRREDGASRAPRSEGRARVPARAPRP